MKCHIWDSWADENGFVGKAYGYQMQVKHQYKEGMMDQVDRVLYDLKENPYSRRIMTNIYVHEDLHEMNLYPCAYSMTFNVTKEEGSEQLTLKRNFKPAFAGCADMGCCLWILRLQCMIWTSLSVLMICMDIWLEMKH